MVINGKSLLSAAPIEDMAGEKRREHGVSYGLSEAGYDVRIKQDVLFLRDGSSDQFLVAIDDKPKPGRFALASTVEKFQMPDNLMGIVHDKSTWARRGLSVFNTVIESGWEGWLTLELVYHGEDDLHIPAGSGIAQVIFHEVMEPAQYTGKYQGQADQPVSARFE